MKTNWISVKERLPPMHKTVLVASYIDGGVGLGYGFEINLAAWSDKEWCSTCDTDYFLDEITHWMFIPKPPKPPLCTVCKIEWSSEFCSHDSGFQYFQKEDCNE